MGEKSVVLVEESAGLCTDKSHVERFMHYFNGDGLFVAD